MILTMLAHKTGDEAYSVDIILNTTYTTVYGRNLTECHDRIVPYLRNNIDILYICADVYGIMFAKMFEREKFTVYRMRCSSPSLMFSTNGRQTVCHFDDEVV